MQVRSILAGRLAPFAGALLALAPSFAIATNLRIATYNIDADTNSDTSDPNQKFAGPGMETVLEGIGNYSINGTAQKLDILALEETYDNSSTVNKIVTDLNTHYGANTYGMSTLQGTDTSPSNPVPGNGPNAIVYNKTTLTLLNSTGVGTPQGGLNGEYRQVMRYEFQPISGTAANDFYVYVTHSKSGSGSSDLIARGNEATIIRADEATLPANASVIYTGDFNLGASTETSYTTMTAAGPGQAFDPINQPGNWALNSAFKGIETESATNLRFRDDFELVTSNIISGTGALKYVANSYQAFGNNGTTAINGDVSDPSNTALTGLANRANVLTGLTTATDHLPVIADFTIVPEPGTISFIAIGTFGLLSRRRRHAA